MNTIKRGAIFGLIAFIFLIIYTAVVGYQTAIYYSTQTAINYSNLTTISLNLILLISSIGILFYYLAFLKLGKKHNNKLLTIISKIFVIFAYINLFLTFLSMVLSFIGLAKAQETTPTIDPYLIISILVILIIFVIILSALTILFGIGIKRLKDVKYSRITGLLYIISGATMIILIGFILLWVSNFYAVALLFNEAKKPEKKIKK